MAKNKASSKGQQAHYQAYKLEERWLKNRLKKRQRHSKEHPNDNTYDEFPVEKGYRRNKFKGIGNQTKPKKGLILSSKVKVKQTVKEQLKCLGF